MYLDDYGITINLDADKKLDQFSMDLLRQYYMRSDEKSPQEAFARAAYAYSFGDKEFAQRIYDYASKGWFMFSTPILANAPKDGVSWKGLPVSCYVTYTGDTLKDLIDHTTELRWVSVKGGGVGGYWGAVRGVSEKSPGIIPFLKTVDSDMLAYQQTSVRRGSYAAYTDMSHPDILEVIGMRTPSGGDPGRKCLNLHHGICIPDKFMEALSTDAEWELIDPHSQTVVDTISARKLWQSILETRMRTGEPYLFFTDTANKALPQCLKDLGLYIYSSQLCTEIMLPTSVDRTAICVLLSVVADYFDEWSKTNMVQDLIRFLDNVTEVFIRHAPRELRKAVYSAKHERSLGLGLMGFHSYLQSKGIPFEGLYATIVNHNMFSHLKNEAELASRQLAKERGEFLDGIGTGLRNAHLLAIAPNANTSIIGNTSPSIEPINSNAYTHRTRAGSYLVKNKHLEKIINSKGLTPTEIELLWSDIMTHNGSIQHLDIFDDEEKAVFKTAFEIDQRWVINHAAARQPYICQGQSVNLFLPANTDRAYLNELHLSAWKQGLKSLYYLRSTTSAQVDKVSHKIKRESLADFITSENTECLSCHA